MFDSIVDALADSPYAERFASSVQPAVKKAFVGAGKAGDRVKTFLHGAWLGHPLHPVLTDIPIGAWSMAAMLDLVAAARDDQGLAAAADVCVAVGLAAAVPTAITGLNDWSETFGRPARVGVWHAQANVTAVALYIGAVALRRRNRRAGRRLSFLAFACANAGAFLGGHLVFAQQIGVNHAAQQNLFTEFEDAVADAELGEGAPLRVTVRGRKLVLVRQYGTIFALLESCSHLGGPLARGTVEDGTIRCPWHGSVFALRDGRVIHGPATSPQPCFETRVVDGRIQVRATSGESP